MTQKKLWQQLKILGYKNKSNESTKVVLKFDIETCDDPKQLQTILTHLIQNIASDLMTRKRELVALL